MFRRCEAFAPLSSLMLAVTLGLSKGAVTYGLLFYLY